MMRHALSILLLSVVPLAAIAQGTGFDMQTLSEQDITGTSRYVGLAGAMGALGGDWSSVKDNPAGLGVYRRSEVAFSIGEELKSYPGNSGYTSAFSLPAISWVFNFNQDNRQKGVLANNIALSYQRLHTFRSGWSYSGNGLASSQTDYMADQANGLAPATLASSDAYDNGDVGWLSKLGCDGLLIMPQSAGSDQWQSTESGTVNSTLSGEEYGYVDDYSFAWGMNVSNKWYVGLGINLRALSYTKNTKYSENFESGDSYDLTSQFTATGVGINFSAGFICRPVAGLRIGAAIETPTFATIKYASYGRISSGVMVDSSMIALSPTLDTSFVAGTRVSASSSPYDAYSTSVSQKMPIRTSVSWAYTFGSNGLISMEYDYQHGFQSNMQDEHLLKFGGEAVVKNNCFFDFGYALQLNGPYKSGEDVYYPSYTTTRTDTDFRHAGMKHYASCGVSFRNSYLTVGCAYQFAYRLYDTYAHAYQDESFEAMGDNTKAVMTHRITVSLAWRYKR